MKRENGEIFVKRNFQGYTPDQECYLVTKFAKLFIF